MFLQNAILSIQFLDAKSSLEERPMRSMSQMLQVYQAQQKMDKAERDLQIEHQKASLNAAAVRSKKADGLSDSDMHRVCHPSLVL